MPIYVKNMFYVIHIFCRSLVMKVAVPINPGTGVTTNLFVNKERSSRGPRQRGPRRPEPGSQCLLQRPPAPRPRQEPGGVRKPQVPTFLPSFQSFRPSGGLRASQTTDFSVGKLFCKSRSCTRWSSSTPQGNPPLPWSCPPPCWALPRGCASVRD